MIDPTFGSHYVQSALDLAVQAGSQLKGPAPARDNVQEAIRLYWLAIKDMQLAVQDLPSDKSQEYIDACHAKIITWASVIDTLKNGTYVHSKE